MGRGGPRRGGLGNRSPEEQAGEGGRERSPVRPSEPASAAAHSGLGCRAVMDAGFLPLLGWLGHLYPCPGWVASLTRPLGQAAGLCASQSCRGAGRAGAQLVCVSPRLVSLCSLLNAAVLTCAWAQGHWRAVVTSCRKRFPLPWGLPPACQRG